LCEEIITGLSRFSYLRVIARASTSRYTRQPTDLRTAGKELGARYVLDGSLRQSGTRIRATVQLSDRTTGAQLWPETYERPFTPETMFELQDDLAPRIVSTMADAYGVLPKSMSQALRGKPIAQLTPHEALLRSFSFAERVTSEEHAIARAAIEHALEFWIEL
jgi:TolB-like protein